MTFSGFPRRTRFTPVPNPLLGPLLEQIDDLSELKCTLRIIWLLHQKKGSPRVVTLEELRSDRSLARSLGGDRRADGDLERALARATERGTLVAGTVASGGDRATAYALNDEAGRRALDSLPDGARDLKPDGDQGWEEAPQPPNVFALYEQNVGILSPMIADELRHAEEDYPAEWIEEAIRESVAQNKRSWRYVARILERWELEGRDHARPGTHPQETGRKRYY